MEFFQRLSKGAEAVKFSVENLSHALDRLKESSGEKLGGSDAAKRLDALVDAGNFAGNSGVGQLRGANSGEERIRAFASFFDQALRSGERERHLGRGRRVGVAERDVDRAIRGDGGRGGVGPEGRTVFSTLSRVGRARSDTSPASLHYRRR